MNTPSDTKSGSSFDLEPDPYREVDAYRSGWDISGLMPLSQGKESTNPSSCSVYFAGRTVRMEAATPESFPDLRTYPAGWDLSLLEQNQPANEMVEQQSGYSVDWMGLPFNASSIEPLDLDAAK